MSVMNRVELVGGLVRDPSLRALPSGTMVCNFSVALDETYWDSKANEKKIRTSFIGCVAWAETAEFVGDQFRKGDQVHVLGELTQETVEKEDGTKDSKTKVRALLVRGVRKGRRAGEDDGFLPNEVPEF